MPFVERKSAGGGTFFKWDTIGKEFRGQYVRLGEGRYKDKPTYHAVMIQDGTGAEMKVTTPTVLARRLRDEFQPGARLHIVYTDNLPAQAGQTAAKNFWIAEWVNDGAPAGVTLPTQQPPVPAPPQPIPPLPVPLPVPAPFVPPPANETEYDRLKRMLAEKVGETNMPLMVKMLESYPSETQRIEAIKVTLRTNYGVQV